MALSLRDMVFLKHHLNKSISLEQKNIFEISFQIIKFEIRSFNLVCHTYILKIKSLLEKILKRRKFS